jgi:IS5 family transposase
LIDGRPSTPVEVILRMLIVKHLYDWSYEHTEQFVSDSLVLRQFCRLYTERVPDDTTLIRWAKLIQPTTLHDLLDHVVDLARQSKVTRGRKLRIDGTVVETTIHHPTDSSLLNDGVRVLSRTIRRAKQLLRDATSLGRAAFRDRTRSAKRQAKRIEQAISKRGEQADATRQRAYRHLIRITTASMEQAGQVRAALKNQASRSAHKLAETLSELLPRVEQVIEQTRRRVLHGEQVSAAEKIVSLFEPHTAIIRKDTRANHTSFGRLIFLDEVDGGLISRYAVLSGNPSEAEQVVPSVDHHLARFKQPPRLLVGDRGTHSTRVQSRMLGRHMKHKAGLNAGAVGGPALRGASVGSNAALAWNAAGIMAMMGWNAGSAGV